MNRKFNHVCIKTIRLTKTLSCVCHYRIYIHKVAYFFTYIVQPYLHVYNEIQNKTVK